MESENVKSIWPKTAVFFEYLGKLLAEFRHIFAELHDCDDSLKLVMNFLPSKLFEPQFLFLTDNWLG